MATDTAGTGRDSDKFMLRLPDGMRDQLKAAAEANNRTMNAEVVARLNASLNPPAEASTVTAASLAYALARSEEESAQLRIENIARMFRGATLAQDLLWIFDALEQKKIKIPLSEDGVKEASTLAYESILEAEKVNQSGLDALFARAEEAERAKVAARETLEKGFPVTGRRALEAYRQRDFKRLPRR